LKNNFAAVGVDMGKFRDRFSGMDRFKGGLRWKVRLNIVLIGVTAEIIYS